MEEIDVFIKKHERLINSVSKRFEGIKGYDWKDRLNLGRIVCWKCYKRYKNHKGTKFTTYLTKAVSNEYARLAQDLTYHKKKIVKYIDHYGDLFSFDKKLYTDNIKQRVQQVSVKDLSYLNKDEKKRKKPKVLFGNVFTPVDKFKEREMLMDIDTIFCGRRKDIAILLWQGFSRYYVYKQIRKYYYNYDHYRYERNKFGRDLDYIRNKLSVYFERGT